MKQFSFFYWILKVRQKPIPKTVRMYALLFGIFLCMVDWKLAMEPLQMVKMSLCNWNYWRGCAKISVLFV